MSLIRGLARHLSVGLLGVTTVAAGSMRAPVGQANDPSRFTVLLRGVRIGSETVTVTQSAAGWVISATSQIGQPFDLTTKFEATYAADWQPRQLTIEGLLSGQLITLSTTFAPTSATSDMMRAGQRSSVTHKVSPGTIVLPDNFFGAYEALAARLGSAAVGSRFPVYVAPQAEVTVTVRAVSPRRVVTPDGPIELRQFDLTFAGPSGPIAAEMWIDSRSRLARLVLQPAALTVIRDDLSTVMAREERIRNPGDEDLFIPAAGFNLGATMTHPRDAVGRVPGVVLVAGSGRQDRDETVAGIPIFGQLAEALANAGFLVVRYDKRGMGLSGGRVESATLEDYAGDVASVVNWLRKRKDVDPDRLAVIGHAEGGAVALLAADREERIKAVGLVAASGLSGRDVTLELQRHVLSRSTEPEADKQAKIALQLRVIDAATTGKGWEAVPPDVRRQADTAWFRSWLLFDPAIVMKKIDQPVLVIQGSVDTQVPPAHADRLEVLSRGRKKSPPTHTQKIVVPGVNHLLVAAKTGEVDEYPTLATKSVSPEIAKAIVDWLTTALSKTHFFD